VKKTIDKPLEVLIVPTGTANTASVLAAFERLGVCPRLEDDAGVIADARYVVLPGVGAFEAAARRLDELGLREVLRERVEAQRPTLAICLGLQLLCTASEESPGAEGLDLVRGTVRRFAPELRVPQLGWNRVVPRGCELIEPGDAYFANAYRLATRPENWTCATTDYGGPFASALERGPVLACQFHPELSGDWGARLLARWIERGREVA